MDKDQKELMTKPTFDGGREPVSVRRCIISLTIISTTNLLNFSAYTTLEGLQSNVNPDVGLVALGLLYLAFLLSSMFLPALVLTRLDCRKTLAISTTTYALYTAANFYPVAYFIIPAAVALGIGAALLWAAIRVYVANIARWHAEARSEDVTKRTGVYYGAFFTAFNMSIVVGNLITTLLTATTSHTASSDDTISNSTQTITTISYNSSTQCGLFFPVTAKVADENRRNLAPEQMYIILSVFLAMQIVSAALNFFLYERPPETNNSAQVEMKLIGSKADDTEVTDTRTVSEAVSTVQVVGGESNTKSTMSLVNAMFLLLRRDKAALLMIPLTFRLGFGWSFVMGEYTRSWIACAIGIEHVMRIMAIFGAAAALMSTLSGQILRCITINKLLYATALAETALFTSLFFWQPVIDDDQVWAYYVVGAMMGLTTGILKSQVPSMYSLLWKKPEDTAACSALQGVWESLSMAVLYGFGNMLYPISKVILVLVTLDLGTLLLAVAWHLRDSPRRMWGAS